MVSAFMSKSRKERIRIMSQGVALNKGFEHQIIKLRALVGPTQWEVALWDFLAYVSLAKHVSRCRSRYRTTSLGIVNHQPAKRSVHPQALGCPGA